MGAVRGYPVLPIKPLKPRSEPYIRRPYVRSQFGPIVCQNSKELPCDWMLLSDPKPDSSPKPKRSAKVSPLIRIAAQFPYSSSRPLGRVK